MIAALLAIAAAVGLIGLLLYAALRAGAKADEEIERWWPESCQRGDGQPALVVGGLAEQPRCRERPAPHLVPGSKPPVVGGGVRPA